MTESEIKVAVLTKIVNMLNINVFALYQKQSRLFSIAGNNHFYYLIRKHCTF